MARKCSSCGNNGHNSRTCSGHSRTTTTVFENINLVGGGGGSGVRLFGVQLHVGSSSSSSPPTPMMAMKKCFSMECLSSLPSSAAAPAYYAAAHHLAAAAANSASPSASSTSSLVSVEEGAPEKMAGNGGGYLSDGLMGRAQQERKKGVPWTEDEHRRFLAGLEKLGKGDWRGISRHFVTTRTPTQVASHAQKYFLRQTSLAHKKRRSSLFDVVENADRAAAAATSSTKGRDRVRLKDAIATTTAELPLPALSLGISSRPAAVRPAADHLALARPPSSTSSLSPLQQLPRCSTATTMGGGGGGGASPASLAAPNKHYRHPSSLSLTTPAAAPDLELKISTAAAAARPSDVHHQVQTGSSQPPPTRTPFLGTIRVT